MQNLSQQTLPAGTFSAEGPTLPAFAANKTGGIGKDLSSGGAFPALEGVTISGCTIVSAISMRQNSALYLASRDAGHANVVVKLYPQNHKRNSVVLKRLSILRSPYLVPLLGFGEYQGYPFEVMPFYQEGSLEGERLPETTVKSVVLPQLVQALHQLHLAQLVHNDIKPSNLFWKKKGKGIALGDFGCLSQINAKEDVGGTLAFMAPETVYTKGKMHTAATDVCAMGLTLVALLAGQSPLADMDEKTVRRTWMQGVRCPTGIAPGFAAQLQEMLRYDTDKRTNYDKLLRWMSREKIPLADSGATAVQAYRPRARVNQRPLQFKERILLDIPELVEAAGQDWEFACFLLLQHQLSRFLLQFSEEYYQLAEKCARAFDADDGLFRLLIGIQPGKRFAWCGEQYDSLEDFARRSATKAPLRSDSAPAKFLRLGLLEVYLEKNNGTAEQLSLARDLQHRAMTDPDLAITQLLITMSAGPEFTWYGSTFRTMGDVANWLLGRNEDLDSAVEELYRAKQFEAWLDFIQCGRFIPEVKSRMREVTR